MPSPSYYEPEPKENFIEKCQTYQHEKLQHGVNSELVETFR